MRYPYYIVAPDYRESSSGVCVLHGLCDALNRAGYEAYLYAPSILNADLETPVVDVSLREKHLFSGVRPIFVYPEIVSGDPLATRIYGAAIVRYVLNRESYLTGQSMRAGKDDLFFYYARHSMGASPVDGLILRYPVIDVELFSPGATSLGRVGNLLFISRYPECDIDFSLLPEGVEVLSNKKPIPLSALAEKLRRAKAFYTYEWSVTCIMAMLCGCPVIYLRGFGVDEHELDLLFETRDGSAMIDEVGGLERASSTIHKAREAWLAVEREFPKQLDAFISITQQKASSAKYTYSFALVRLFFKVGIRHIKRYFRGH